MDVRYATQPINSFVWESATPLTGTLSVGPLPAGQMQSVVVPGPLPEPVYFGLKTGDAEGNWSLLSNSAEAAVTRRVFLPLIIK